MQIGSHPSLVIVAHPTPLIAAGLVAVLRAHGEWTILLSDELLPDTLDRQAGGTRPIVLSDRSSASRVMHRAGPHRPRLILIESEAEFGADPRADEIDLADGKLDLGCHPELLVNLVRRVACDRRESAAPPLRPQRGGLAPSVRRRVKQYVEANGLRRIDVSELAPLAGLSICYFARAFKKSFGATPHSYITRRRVESAAERVKATDRPLSEIALEFGFADQSHFTRAFTRAFGMPPGQYRRECR